MNHRLTLAILLCMTSARPARAGEPSNAEIAVARQHFEAATTAETQGRWRDAIDQLNKAITIKETPGLRYHLGFAKENLGLLVDAMLEYERAAGLVPSGAHSEELERFILPKLAEMKKRIPTLAISLPLDAKEVQVQIDGATVKPSLSSAPIRLNPGAHALLVLAPGRRPFRAQITLNEGSAVTQAAELLPEVSGSDPTPFAATTRDAVSFSADRERVQPESGGSARTWALVGEGVVAMAGVGIGIGFLSAANSAQAQYDEANRQVSALHEMAPCTNDRDPNVQASCATLVDASAEHSRDRKIALAGFIAAGAGAAVVVATLLLWKTPLQNDQAKFALVPELSPSGGGLLLAWTP